MHYKKTQLWWEVLDNKVMVYNEESKLSYNVKLFITNFKDKWKKYFIPIYLCVEMMDKVFITFIT